MVKPITRRGLLNSLTVKELHRLSKNNNIKQKKTQTKTGLGSVIMGSLTKDEIVKECLKIIRNR